MFHKLRLAESFKLEQSSWSKENLEIGKRFQAWMSKLHLDSKALPNWFYNETFQPQMEKRFIVFFRMICFPIKAPSTKTEFWTAEHTIESAKAMGFGSLLVRMKMEASSAYD